MFISEKHNFVFFEVPRTGSNSVTAALFEFDPKSPTVLKREQGNIMEEYHHFGLPEKTGKPYIVFAAHRNPYERIWSFWKYRHKWGNPEVFKTTSWQRYVEWACNPSSAPEIQRAMYDVPISEMFDCDRIDFWIKFETLTESWQEFGNKYNLDLPALQVKQSSQPMGDIEDAYNEKIAEMVATRYAADFARFNYDINAWPRR